MEITIALAADDPPEGTLRVSAREPVPFVGWLGLLAALADVMGVQPRRKDDEPPR